MSIEVVKSEIRRFLASSDAEVLCINGKWGVGKTFAWKQFLKQASLSGCVALDHYAYISLFGLNSLDALKNAILENSTSSAQIADGPSFTSYEAFIRGTGVLSGKVAQFSALLGKKDAGEALARAMFLSVKKRIVCIDDLERAGSALELRDVLGLVSMLKEERQCKIVLLLNDEKLTDDNKSDFDRLLEKVVDVSLSFEPSPEEAVAIAFAVETPVNQKLSPKIVKLGITNIRVIKKIERLASRLAELLSTFRAEVLDGGIHAVALGGSSVLQPDSAPPIDFVRRHNSLLSAMRTKEEELPDQERRWKEIIEDYGWSHCDELDDAIFEGVASGYFDKEKITEAAKKLQANFENRKEHSAFSKAWRLYHDSFVIDDDHVLDALFNGAKESLHTVSPLNLNGTTTLLREFGRNEQADELIKLYIAQPQIHGGQLDRDLQMWGAAPVDPKLSAAFEKLKADFVDARDPRDVLIAMVTNRGWDEADIGLLAMQSSDDFEKMFESIEGSNLSSVVKFALSLGAYDGPNHKLIGAAVTAALRSIAAKSPLRRRRIEGYGVTAD